MSAAIKYSEVHTKDEIRYIPFKDLFISPENVRVVSASKDDEKKLLASLKAQGLLQNLVVVPSEAVEGMYEVVAGGRRFGGLTTLVAEKEISEDYEVFCKVKSRADATSVSLSENIKATLHPADEFVAYKKLSDSGKSEKLIAKDFGTTSANVKKLLRLASVAPELIQTFREGKLNFDCIMAFTVSEDHERQLACWKELGRGNISAYSIRNYLLNNTISDNDGIAKFVGLKNYKNAGGAVTSDLFQLKTYLLDVGLIEDLATNKLNDEAKSLEVNGWKWIDISFDGFQAARGLTRLTAELLGVPKKLTDSITEISKEIDDLNEIEFDDLSEEDEAKMDSLSIKLEKLEEEQENYRSFTKEQKLISGCIVTFSDEGNLNVLRGLVKKEDMPKSKPKEERSLQDDPTVESNALVMDLNNYYGQAFQAELLNHEDMAMDLLIYTLASSVLDSGGYQSRLMDLTIRAQYHNAIGIDETKASDQLAEYEARLNTAWTFGENETARFAQFQTLDRKEKMRIMSFCVARSSIAHPKRHADNLSHAVGKLMGFGMNNYWKATKENYFNRVKKNVLVSIGESVAGEKFREKSEKSKKGDLAAVLDQMNELDGWLPELFK